MRVLHVLCILLLQKPVYSGYNADVDLPTPKIIRKYGYKAESHEILTEDGYILQIHRIPNRESKNSPILLQHGLLGSSADWIMNGPNRSIAYQMAKRGYDVWLGNIRGNVYSKGHVSLSPSDTKFWDFSWHEMGYYDLPAVIDYILNETNHSALYYVGHSMGTTMSYVMCSTRPEYNSKIKILFSLAPIGFMSRAKTPLHYLAPYAKNIELIAKWFGSGEFLPRNTIMHYILKLSCEDTVFETKLCENYIFIICGYDPQQFNMKLLPVILGHSPAGASTKTLVHYAQEIESGYFRLFDYGEEKNLQMYGNKFPPNYNLTNIKVPVSLHYSDNDLLSNVQDVRLLHSMLPNTIGMFRVNFSLFNHLDFLWSKDIYPLLNSKVEDLIIHGTTNNKPSENDITKVLPSEKFQFREQKIYVIVEEEKDENTGYLPYITNQITQSWNGYTQQMYLWKDSVVNKFYEIKTFVGDKFS